MCDPHLQIYVDAWKYSMKGIDRPPGADGREWRGSILEHLRHAKIAMDFEDRNQQRQVVASQSEQMEVWRRGVRAMREKRA